MGKLSRIFAVVGAAIIGLGMSAGVLAQNSDTGNVSITVYSGALSVDVVVTGFGDAVAGIPVIGTVAMNVIDGRAPGQKWYVQARIGTFQGTSGAFSRPLRWSPAPPLGVTASNPVDITATDQTVLMAPNGGTYNTSGSGRVEVPELTAPDIYIAVLTTTITGTDPDA
jgi:hypothetical protein